MLHALQILDEINQAKSRRNSNVAEDYKQQDYTGSGPPSKRASIAQNFKNNVIQGLAKNHKQTPGGMNGSANGSTNKPKSPLPAPPVNRRKFSNPKPMHNADFYRHASSPRK